ncbi:MAG: hypothetical protein WD768_10440 [Phycisphaeraceae bacterium]
MRFRLLHRVALRLSHRPIIAGAILLVVAFLSAMLASALAGHPQPSVHDEFSYLLAADTFSNFRLANATHPMWVFFESMHLVMQPSYASMYPPGQGMAMAVGQVLTGDPLVGVWLSAAIMCAGVYWMLRAWLPAKWALLGGAMVLLKYVVLGRAAPTDTAGYWSQSYYGGAVAALGGALIYGALGRILRNKMFPIPLPLREGLGEGRTSDRLSSPSRPRASDGDPSRQRVSTENQSARPSPSPSLRGRGVWHGILLVLGVGIVANSRPFEGFMVALPAAIILLAWFIKQRGPARRPAIQRIIIPASLVMIGVVSFMGYYNSRVTGKPTRMAWQHHHEQYCTFSIFLWQKPRPPGSIKWNHAALEEFHGTWEVDLWNRTRSVEGLAIETGRKLKTLWAFYVAPLPRVDSVIDMDVHGGPPATGVNRFLRETLRGLSVFEIIVGALLTLPLLALPWSLRKRGVLLACIVCGIVVTGNLMTVATLPHYAAPAAAMFVLIYVQCLRTLASSRRAIGRVVFAGVMGITLIAFLGAFNADWRRGRPIWQHERARILAELQGTPAKDLVIVRYGPNHSTHNEWVYNDAEIDAANVVWARDMGSVKNRELLDYFKDRKVWLLDVTDDGAKQELKAYE